jgi:hypothetical protein
MVGHNDDAARLHCDHDGGLCRADIGLRCDQGAPHESDDQCAVDPSTHCCRVCGVMHGDPCPICGGRGFHLDGCAEI